MGKWLDVGTLLGRLTTMRRRNAAPPAPPTPQLLGVPLLEMLAQEQFWVEYWIDVRWRGSFVEVDGRPLQLRVSDRLALELELTEGGCKWLWLHDLARGMRHELGWIDDAHDMPNVLRWDELEPPCRCVAAREPALRHPRVVLLLLQPFVALTAEDDLDAVQRRLREGWDALGLFAPSEIAANWDTRDDVLSPEIEHFVSGRNMVQDAAAFRWAWSTRLDMWTASGAWPNSLRIIDNDVFPFALLRELVAQARTCADVYQ